MMRINLSDAKGQLLDLVKRVEEGEDVVLLRRGVPVARLILFRIEASAAGRRAALATARGTMASGGATAARSQDFLYGEDGLPS